MTFFKIEKLTYYYPHAKEATILDFSTSIEQGEIVGILGQSGSGKSTLLRLIAGLEMPASGTITIDGKTVVDSRTFIEPEVRGVGMVFQDYALFPHLTVEENILFGLHRLPKRERRQRLQDMLELVKLSDFARRYPHELSGGQQQRVALARALAPQPSILLMDEPFSNLDANLKAEIRDELKAILQAADMTSILVTHDQEDVQAICNRTIMMEAKVALAIG